MIRLDVAELGWCAACNSIVRDAHQLTFSKVGGSERRVTLCDDCRAELAAMLNPVERRVPEMPVWMMEV